MGVVEHTATTSMESPHRAAVPPRKSFLKSLKENLKETFFPDDPLRQFKNQSGPRKLLIGLRYVFPIAEWAPRYTVKLLKADIVAGFTTATVGIPQGISYAKLADLPPVVGLYTSFVPPLVYAMMGSSRDLVIGTTAVGSLLIAAELGHHVSADENPQLYMHMALTATFFAGLFQAALGIFRLGFIVDFLSQATIIGFMAGVVTVVCMQQLKGIFGLRHFTSETDVVSVMRSVFTQTHEWRWETATLGGCVLFYLLTTKYFSKKTPKLFWASTLAPLTSVVVGSLLVYLTQAEKRVQVIGGLKKGINPVSFQDLEFGSAHLMVAIKTGIVIAVIALAEGVAAGRSFAMLKNYQIDGNKEMIAFGMMNIIGSGTSCYCTTGPFSRSAVNYGAGGMTAASNIIMAVTVMITLLFLTPLFYYTPLVVLSSIIISAMLGLLDYEGAVNLYKIDKFDFVVSLSAYFGVVFSDIETGLMIAVALSVLRILLFIARPRTSVQGSVSNSDHYRSIDQYPTARIVPGILILEIGSPVYFTNAIYLKERISRWVDREVEKLKSSVSRSNLQHLILDMTAVGYIDTSGVNMIDEVKNTMDRRGIKLLLANPGGEVMKKLERSRFIESLGEEWIFMTVGDAVRACNYVQNNCSSDRVGPDQAATGSNNIV